MPSLKKGGRLPTPSPKSKNTLCRFGGAIAQPNKIVGFRCATPNLQDNGEGIVINYRVSLQQTEPERILYLAVTEDAYEAFFTLLFTRTVVEQNQLKIIIYNPNEEVIVEWKN